MKYVPVVLACALTVGLAAACSSERSPSRRIINLPGKRADLPYSHGVVVGNTLYLGGRIGLDPKTVESGMIHSAQNVYTEYPDPREWERKILPALKKVPLTRLVKMSGKSRRMLINARVGRTRPHRKNQELLASIVRKLGII